jgi:hypothetical protein
MDSAYNIVLIGGPGTGKTHVATALGVQAVEHHRKKVRFFSTVELVNALEQERLMETPASSPNGWSSYPHVFALAWAVCGSTDSRFDPQMLCRFVRAHQRVQPLTIGELWAVAITLRIVLVENLRRPAAGIGNYQAARQEADSLADRLLGVDGRATDQESPSWRLHQVYCHTAKRIGQRQPPTGHRPHRSSNLDTRRGERRPAVRDVTCCPRRWVGHGRGSTEAVAAGH